MRETKSSLMHLFRKSTRARCRTCPKALEVTELVMLKFKLAFHLACRCQVEAICVGGNA